MAFKRAPAKRVNASCGGGGAVRVWRLAGSTPLMPPLVDLSESVWDIAIHGNVIVTATGADIAVCQPASP